MLQCGPLLSLAHSFVSSVERRLIVSRYAPLPLLEGLKKHPLLHTLPLLGGQSNQNLRCACASYLVLSKLYHRYLEASPCSPWSFYFVAIPRCTMCPDHTLNRSPPQRLWWRSMNSLFFLPLGLYCVCLPPIPSLHVPIRLGSRPPFVLVYHVFFSLTSTIHVFALFMYPPACLA